MGQRRGDEASVVRVLPRPVDRVPPRDSPNEPKKVFERRSEKKKVVKMIPAICLKRSIRLTPRGAFVILSIRRIEQRIGKVSAPRRIPTVGSWQFEIAGNLGNKIVEMPSGS
jgi:hypothetical protein